MDTNNRANNDPHPFTVAVVFLVVAPLIALGTGAALACLVRMFQFGWEIFS